MFTLLSGYRSPAGFANPGPRQGEPPLRMDLFNLHENLFKLLSPQTNKQQRLQLFPFSRRSETEKSCVSLSGETARLGQSVGVHRRGMTEVVKQKRPAGAEALDWVPVLPSCREENSWRPAVLPGRDVNSLETMAVS